MDKILVADVVKGRKRSVAVVVAMHRSRTGKAMVRVSMGGSAMSLNQYRRAHQLVVNGVRAERGSDGE